MESTLQFPYSLGPGMTAHASFTEVFKRMATNSIIVYYTDVGMVYMIETLKFDKSASWRYNRSGKSTPEGGSGEMATRYDGQEIIAMCVRFPKELYDRIRADAVKENRSLGRQCVELCTIALQERDASQGKHTGCTPAQSPK